MTLTRKGKKRKTLEWIILVTLIIAAIAALLTVEPVANAVGGVFKVAGVAVQNVAKTVFFSAIGLLLIYFGVLATGSPLFAALLIAIGLFLLVKSIWPVLFPNPKRIE